MEVKVWKEIVTIPTYEIGEPEKNPIFLEKRVYQGSSGSVYPHPVVEKISDECIDKKWTAIYLENKYLKIMILPELGGRVQMAYDKMKERHFVYYNRVIKPALVGLTGPWISGGIEFNWPQHHRPSTYNSVDFQIKENDDGSKTVWCSEVERMFRTKGMAGFTLHPDKAYLEVKAKIYNRTAQPQTFLWWANPAVKVNDQYQSVFPPDVNAVFDHGKRDVSEFPIAKGEYYKVDYSPGTDISKYKNIPVPTSYMAIQSAYDFVGGYENDSKGGLLHVANHHISPGKKQWTWGNGEFGKAWDRNLTEVDGPYIELMCGVYTDNQPDFSWIMPYEEKTFSQYFMPYRDLGVVKNATKEALLNLEIENGRAVLRAFATSTYSNSLVKVEREGQILIEDSFDFHPRVSYHKEFYVDPLICLHELKVTISDHQGIKLVGWQAEKPATKPIPKSAIAAEKPEAIKSLEQLHLTGQHLEQYRHATFNPADYYKEVLNQEPGNIRSNNAMGLLLLRKGKFSEAQSHFERAIQTMTQRNPNPYDGETYFNLGQSLRYQGKEKEAYSAFYKAIWNDAWKASGYFHIAQLECSKGEWELALENIDKALISNWHNHKARHLKIIILRELGLSEKAKKLIHESLELDGFNFGGLFEKYLFDLDEKTLNQFKSLIRGNIHTYIEYALDYLGAGQHQVSLDLLDIGISCQENTYPLAHYYKGWIQAKSGNNELAFHEFELAEKCSSDYCFPNQLESVLALQNAILINPKGSKAYYYLGNFWYAAQQVDDAVKCWEQSIELKSSFSIVQRNLALAYYNKLNKKDAALNLMEKAFVLNNSDPRILMELDQLYKKLNHTQEKRLDFLTENLNLTEKRDDTYLELICLNNLAGQNDKALEMITNHVFHPWEGGEGKVIGQYVLSLVEMAKKSILVNEFEKAIQYLDRAKVYPHNLGEGKLLGQQENDINYWLGCAYDGLNNVLKAKEYWQLATAGSSEPKVAWFYNDQQPDKIFYQGLAFLKLNKMKEANIRFKKLIDFGENHLSDQIKIDYFAVSMPDLLIWEEDLQIRNQIYCHYLIGLGYKGMGMNTKAKNSFKKVLEADNFHCGVYSNYHI